jgi:hypothetical protein
MPNILFGPVPVWQRCFETIEDRLQLWRDEARKTGPGTIAVIVGIIVAIYFIVRLAFVEWKSRRRVSKIRYQSDDLLAAYVRRFNRFLKNRKITVLEGETWSELLDRTSELQNDRDLIQIFVTEYNAVRYGGANDRDGHLNQMLEEIEKREVAKEKV